MNKQSIEAARDSDLRLSQHAMQRAARRAHELVAQTGTAVVFSHNGVIEQIRPGLGQVAQGVQEPEVPHGEKE